MSYDPQVIQAAQDTAAAALDDVLSRLGAERAVVTKAVAGAGKTGFVVEVVGAASERGLRQIVCTPTNLQAFALVERIAARYSWHTVTFVPATNVQLPANTAARPNVQIRSAQASHDADLIVATFDKIGDAYARGHIIPVDLLLADESYQADAAKYYAVAGVAPTHLLVGDPGQLDPFSTMDGADQWRGQAEDPLQTAVGVVLRNHPETTSVYQMPVTRRLDPRAVPIARSFYPGHAFQAAVLPGVRRLRLLPGLAQDARTRMLDNALDLASSEGWAHVELPDAPVLTADPETIDLIVGLVRRLQERSPKVQCELHAAFTDLSMTRVAVGVSHNDQADQVRIALAAAGLPDVVVSTANRLQGLEFDLVIAWHPLAGLPDEPDGFHLDPGRLCVLLTRHRHACIVVGRAGDRAFLDGIPPRTPAYLGWLPDPVLDGWAVHQLVFQGLDRFRVAA